MACSSLSDAVKVVDGSSVAGLSHRDEMFVNRMSIADLVMANCTGKLEGCGHDVTLKATIVRLCTKSGWYYLCCRACMRKRKLVVANGDFSSNTCERTVDSPLTLFRVVAKVQDNTGSTILFLFNTSVEGLARTSAKKILVRLPPGDNSTPPQLMTLLGQQFVFKIKLGSYNTREGFQNYPVSDVFIPIESLETEYEKTLASKPSDGAPDSPAHGEAIPGVDNEKKRNLMPAHEGSTKGGDASK